MSLLRRVQGEFLNGLLSAGHLVLIVVALEAGERWVEFPAIGLLALIALLAWLAAFRRYHAIADTPTARIASAAQGYVELVGQAALLPGARPLGFGTGPPCVWYRYRVYRDGKLIDSGQSHDTFLLDDGSGECVIDPDFAEFRVSTQRRTKRDSYTTKAEYLGLGEQVYALGSLTTLGGSGLRLDRNDDVRELLGEWKQDPNRLLERFDANSDGQIDLTEWQVARREAAEEVDRRHAELRLHPDTHILRAPADGRPFIVSSVDPTVLVRRYRWWAWFHAAVFVGALAWLLTRLFGA